MYRAAGDTVFAGNTSIYIGDGVHDIQNCRSASCFCLINRDKHAFHEVGFHRQS